MGWDGLGWVGMGWDGLGGGGRGWGGVGGGAGDTTLRIYDLLLLCLIVYQVCVWEKTLFI